MGSRIIQYLIDAARGGQPWAVLLLIILTISPRTNFTIPGGDGCGDGSERIEPCTPPISAYSAAHCASCPSGGEPVEIKGAALAPVEQRIREMDRAFVSNNLTKILAVLGPEDTPAKRDLECLTKMRLENATFLSRESKIIKAIRIGGTDAVYVSTETAMRPRTTKPGELIFDRRQRSANVLFFSWDVKNPSGNAAPLLSRMERFDEDAAVLLNNFHGRIGCAPCGWNIAKPSGWFLVPRVAGEGAAFDSLSFIHPNLKISMDFDCYTNPTVTCPLEQAVRDHDVLVKFLNIKDNSVKIIKKQAQMDGDAVRADFIADYPDCKDPKLSTRVHRCYRLSSPFLFNFVVRGDARELAAHNFEIQPVLESLHINKSDFANGADIERVSKTHMTGGCVNASCFRDEELGVYMDPPEGWHSQTLPGVGRFCVRYLSPADENISLTFFAWEGESRCYGEQDVQRFFENRRAMMCSKEYEDWKVLRSEVIDHQNTVDVSFEIESQWTSGAESSKKLPMQELVVAIPAGKFLCGFVARAPKSEFNRLRDIFGRSVASFRHNSQR
ncbi:MAG: hypothetical protein HY286_02805 [Planctomycetes bacterium]|nr:hypothetical protein [Planctomycetota bacterium]